MGIIGLPNAGKSTLISVISSATPKIDSYPFTTLTPNLGVVQTDWGDPFVVADIPGLIEGAHDGAGLGMRFLKHIERTNLLLHLLDITYEPDHYILEDFNTIKGEMEAYNPELTQKPQMVLINKMDLYGSNHRDLEELQKALESIGVASLPISALTGQGLDELKGIIYENWAGQNQ